MNPKFFGMLGLAKRAGKLAVGEGAAAEAVRGGKAAVLLLSTDASANTEKKFLNMTRFYEIQMLRPGDRTALGGAIGASAAVVVAVTDVGFGSQLQKLIETAE